MVTPCTSCIANLAVQAEAGSQQVRRQHPIARLRRPLEQRALDPLVAAIPFEVKGARVAAAGRHVQCRCGMPGQRDVEAVAEPRSTRRRSARRSGWQRPPAAGRKCANHEVPKALCRPVAQRAQQRRAALAHEATAAINKSTRPRRPAQQVYQQPAFQVLARRRPRTRAMATMPRWARLRAATCMSDLRGAVFSASRPSKAPASKSRTKVTVAVFALL